MLEKITKKIETEKEILSTLPQNNKKNKENTLKYINDLIEENKTIKNLINKEITIRYNNLTKNNVNNEIDNLKDKITQTKKDLKILNPFNTSYEKSNLDKILNKISHFYKEDFISLNENIEKIMKIFKEIGITLTTKDFSYSTYAKEYMQTFLEIKDLNSNKLKTCFEELYWKCPNIIFHIELNFNYLYYKNKQKFDKYFKTKQTNINKKVDNIYETYEEYIINYKNLTDINPNILLNKFLAKEYIITNYSKEAIDKIYASLNVSDNDIESIIKLNQTLLEYKEYQEFKYIIDHVKSIYKEKDKYKNIYKNKLKEITKLETKLMKLNKNLTSKFKIFQKKSEKNTLELNNIINNLIQLYDELNIDAVNEIISNLEENTTIHTILSIVLSYYSYLRKCIIDNIEEKELTEEITKLEKFVLNPNLNIINNTSILEEKDIPMIISDRYKLLSIKISKEDIENNLDNLIDQTNKIIIYNNIKNSSIKYEDIKFVCEAHNIINN